MIKIVSSNFKIAYKNIFLFISSLTSESSHSEDWYAVVMKKIKMVLYNLSLYIDHEICKMISLSSLLVRHGYIFFMKMLIKP